MEFDGSQCKNYRADMCSAEVVGTLVSVMGRKLTAYLGGAKEVRVIDTWLRGEHLDSAQEIRFRLALRIVDILLQKEHPDIIQSWMIGVNPELGDRVPLSLLRNEPLEEIADDLIAAATAMVVYG